MPHELCEVAARHRRGWHLLATHAQGLLECEGLLESPSSSSYPVPKEALGSAVLSQALGTQRGLGSLRDVLCSTEQAAGNCSTLKALP